METVLVEVLKQVPATGCVLIVVWYFLQYMKQERVDSRQFLEQMSTACHASQAIASEALAENTRMLGRAAHVVETAEGRHGMKPQVQ